jgi:hypothetical protein
VTEQHILPDAGGTEGIIALHEAGDEQPVDRYRRGAPVSD